MQRCFTARSFVVPGLVVCLLLCPTSLLAARNTGTVATAAAWWVWPAALFAMTFAMGILAVMAGVGGGSLFVPIVSSFCPFHLSFVEGMGLLVAMCSSLAAGPSLLHHRLASLRLAMPVGLIASFSAVAGAIIGLSLPVQVVRTALGTAILAIAFVMLRAQRSDFPDVPRPDRLSQALGIFGIYREGSLGRDAEWRLHHTVPGLLLFVGVGFMAGMFGLGAGWANVPVLNLVMGVPLKVSVATSTVVLSVTSSSAAWIYLNQGCVIPMLAVPSIVGIMLGSFVGARLFRIVKPATVRWLVIAILLFAGGKEITAGLGLPFIV